MRLALLTLRSARPARLPALLAALVVTGIAGTVPAAAQDGTLLRQIFGQIGILPAEKDPIEYYERPGLVVPKDTAKLRPPEEGTPETRNPAWPVDPDAAARRRAEAARNEPSAMLLSGRRATDGARLSVDEIARGRVQRGTALGEADFTRNDHAGVRVSPEEWSRIAGPPQAARLAPGVEPPRNYLTDPPKGMRVPAGNAPIVRTQEFPSDMLDNGRPRNVWVPQRD